MNKNNGLNTSELILTENVVAVDFSSRNGLVDDGKKKGGEEDTIIQLDGLGSNQFTREYFHLFPLTSISRKKKNFLLFSLQSWKMMMT